MKEKEKKEHNVEKQIVEVSKYEIFAGSETNGSGCESYYRKW